MTAASLVVAKYYDHAAQSYEDKYLRTEYYRTLYRKVGEVLDKYINAGMRVLDIGAGTGFWTAYMTKRGARVVALDISPMSVKRCRCEDKVVGDAALPSAGAGRFDAVTALGSVYNHMVDLNKALRRISHAVKKGGLMIADIDNALCLDMLYEYLLFQGLGKLKEALTKGRVAGVWESIDGEIPFYYYTYFSVKSALHDAGFKIVETRPIYIMPVLPTRILQRSFKTKFLEKLDLLKPLAPFATTVIYVAKKL
ncbi:Methylase involved in ubiquinone/menaquinone biosynthesis [Pyrobaculum oguniense TE7]|uniref:Methylase involved in ubiquinone/menaquinone biosynthesis n=1 Tax=Pyrobaculum oguniense (strain DSM 13380 / JCM 10595 / TE7) TaxID=698757 RepID=H6Q9M2_PYROT|nr:Methylase involved in ubiquinone/menaquinone biosynthesis [Pyrobaculum oguniense TE7]